MLHRVQDLTGIEPQRFWGGTFHSLGHRALRLYGEAIGLKADWAASVIRAVGNYGEMYEHTVGPNTPLGIPRGLNALWKNGGLMYAPPIR